MNNWWSRFSATWVKDKTTENFLVRDYPSSVENLAPIATQPQFQTAQELRAIVIRIDLYTPRLLMAIRFQGDSRIKNLNANFTQSQRVTDVFSWIAVDFLRPNHFLTWYNCYAAHAEGSFWAHAYLTQKKFRRSMTILRETVRFSWLTSWECLTATSYRRQTIQWLCKSLLCSRPDKFRTFAAKQSVTSCQREGRER